VGAFGAYAHQLWKYSKDAFLARVDETCALIYRVADQGAEYWLLAKPDLSKKSANGSEECDLSSRYERLVLVETQISGRLQQLQFLRVILQRRFSLADERELVERMATFESELTGGDFAARFREPDLERAKLTYKAASDLAAHLRAGADRGNRLWRIVFTRFERIGPLPVFLVSFVVGCVLTISAGVAIWVWWRG
jgi:hypothetical protein